MPLGAARAPIIRAKGAAEISLVRAPTFFDVAGFTDPLDQLVTFDGTENLVIVMISYETDRDIVAVTIDPGGGQQTALSAIGSESVGDLLTITHAFGVFGFTPVSGSLTVRVDPSDTVNGASFGVWQFANATRLPTTGDHDLDNSTGGATSLTGSISIGAGEESGILIGAANVNGGPDVTPGGGQTQRFEQQTHDGGFTTCFSDERGGLSGTEAPSFSWPSGARSSAKWVLAA